MNKIRQINIWLWLCACCLMAGCDKDVHNDPEPGGLAVALAWLDSDDTSTKVDNIHIWIFSASDGRLVKEDEPKDALTLADHRYRLDKGDYKVVAAVNLLQPFEVRDGATYNDMLIALTSADASPCHAFWGVNDVTIEDTEKLYTATVAQKRVMAELSIVIEGVPEGAVLNGTVTNATTGIYPCRKDNDADYGVTLREEAAVALPSTQSQGTAIETETVRLMPTAYGQSLTLMQLTLTTPNGVVREYSVKAQKMKIAGKYQIRLKYAEMQPYMYLSSVAISQWLEGWVYIGEIYNPE